jgi:hypothetical protein
VDVKRKGNEDDKTGNLAFRRLSKFLQRSRSEGCFKRRESISTRQGSQLPDIFFIVSNVIAYNGFTQENGV